MALSFAAGPPPDDLNPAKTKTVTTSHIEWGTYHYFCSFAVSFGYRAIPTTDANIVLNKIWGNGQLWYDRATDKRLSSVKWYFLPGTEDQTAPEGAELAYRGQIVLWFSGMDLGTGGDIPTISAEFEDGDNVTVLDALTLISERAGYDPGAIHVSASLGELPITGYILDGQATLETVSTDLAFLYDFDFVETGGEIYFVQSYVDNEFVVTLTIPDELLAVLSEGGDGQQIDKLNVGSDQSLPRSINGTYFDIDNDFQQGSQSATRHGDQSVSQSDVSIAVPVIMTGQEMRSRLFDALARTWDERNTHALRLPPQYMQIEPTDVLGFNVYSSDYTGVIVKATLNADWSTTVSLTERSAERPTNDVETQQPALPISAVTPEPVRVVVMDITDTDPTQTVDGYLNFRVAMGGTHFGEWNGAQFQFAPATNMNNWVTVYAANRNSEVGIGDLIAVDDADTMRIDLRNFNPDRFAEATDDEIAAGANRLVIGRPGHWEHVQYRHVTIALGIATITGLERGQFGTDDWQDDHLAGDTVVFFDDTTTIQYTVDEFRAFLSYVYRAVPAFAKPEDQTAVSFRPAGNSRRPYSPNNVQCKREINGDLTFTWERDDRFDGEPDEVYSLDLYSLDWSHLVRRVNNNQRPYGTYPVDTQTEDGVETDTIHNILIFQMNASHVGRGFPGGGGIAETTAGILDGEIGPVAGFVVQAPWAGEFGGPVWGFAAQATFGVRVSALVGEIGPVRGFSGVLRHSPWYARFGGVAGFEAGMAEVEFPTLVLREVGIVSGTIPTSPVIDLGSRLRRGDLVFIHDYKYGFTSHHIYERSEANPELTLLAVDDHRATDRQYQAYYYGVVGNPFDFPEIGLADTSFVNPLAWCAVEVLVFRHVDTANPIADFQYTHVGTDTISHTAPVSTTANPNSHIAMGVSARGQGRTYTPPAGITDLGAVNSLNDTQPDAFGGDNGPTIDAGDVFKVSAGSFGPKTWTYSIARPYMSWSLAVNFGAPPPFVAVPPTWDIRTAHIEDDHLEIEIPAGLNGDLIYVYVYSNTAPSLSAAATSIGPGTAYTAKVNQPATIARQQLWSKVADGSEGTEVALTWAASAKRNGVVIRVHDSGGELGISSIMPDTNNYPINLPSIADLQVSDVLFAIGASSGEIVMDSVPSDFTPETETLPPDVAALSKVVDTLGASGPVNFTAHFSTRRGGVLIAVAAALTPTWGAVFGPVVGTTGALEVLSAFRGTIGPVAGLSGDLEAVPTGIALTFSQIDSGTTQVNSIVCPLPSDTQIGDLLYYYHFQGGANPAGVPAVTVTGGGTGGFATVANNSTIYQQREGHRVVDGTESSSITFTYSGTNTAYTSVVLVRVRNHSGHDAIAGVISGSNGITTLVAPAVTTTVNADFMLHFFGYNGQQVTVTPPAGLATEQVYHSAGVGVNNATNIHVFSETAGSAGSQGTRTFTFGAINRPGVRSVAIKP